MLVRCFRAAVNSFTHDLSGGLVHALRAAVAARLFVGRRSQASISAKRSFNHRSTANEFLNLECTNREVSLICARYTLRIGDTSESGPAAKLQPTGCMLEKGKFETESKANHKRDQTILHTRSYSSFDNC